MPPTPQFRTDDNCWRTSRADRGGFLLSTSAYFRAFREACLAARHEIILLGWDLWGSVEMVRGEQGDQDDDYPNELGEFILAILEEKPELKVKILLWDYSVIYMGRRELVPLSRWRNPGHPRLELVTDDAIATGASHHQKLAVIDGALAFCGGVDLAAYRWDRPEHRVREPLRRTPLGQNYGPHHDIQVALAGPVVKDLRELASQRWERATGACLEEFASGDPGVPWPDSVPLDFEDEPLALALTFSRFRDLPAVYHIEKMHLEMIAVAQDYLYFENQYLSSHRVVAALEERLREEDGPEVVVVLNRKAGWLEDSTLGLVARRLLERLRMADRHGRFSGYYPQSQQGEDRTEIYVHAKMMLADDRMLLGGSANLSNRSMRVDSELNLCFAYDEPVAFIKNLRDNLLAMHLGIASEKLREAAAGAESLRALIEAVGENEGEGRSLKILADQPLSQFQRRLADSRILDPEEPLSPMHHAWDVLRGQYEMFRNESSSSLFTRGIWLASVLFGLVVAALLVENLWGGQINHSGLMALLEPLRDPGRALPYLLVILVVAGLVGIPINLILIGSTFALGPWLGFCSGLGGALVAASLSFALGRFFEKEILRFAGARMDALSSSFADCDFLSMAVVRLLPIAPFGVINLASGLSGMPFRVFMVGSLLGLIPGLAAITLTAHQFFLALKSQAWSHWLIFFALAAILAGVFVWVRRKLAGRS